MSKLWRVGSEEIAYVTKAIKNGLDGKFCTEFEERFSEKFGVDYAIALNSGTSALHATLGAIGIGEGDEVIVPPLTFIATTYAVLYVGAVPIFADIDPSSFNISPHEIQKKITSKTKAIITVSIYGLPPQLTEIRNIADKNNIFLIEDNAQCIFGKCDNKIAGTFGHASIFSLQRSKHLTTGDGGVVLTDNENIAEKVRKFADLGYARLTAKPINNENFKNIIQHPSYKRHSSIGYNFRLSEVCCAMGIAQLEKIDLLLNLREKISLMYKDAVYDCKWLKSQSICKNLTHSWWTFVLRIIPEETNTTWDEFKNTFKKNGGDSFYGAWSLSYLEPALEGKEFKESNIIFKKGLCKVAEKIQPNLIQLKTNYKSIEMMESQVNALRKTIIELS